MANQMYIYTITHKATGKGYGWSHLTEAHHR